MSPRRFELADEGFSLVELIIYIFLTALISVVIGTILINTWTTQSNVSTVTQATDRGQLVSSTVERAMRNAVEFAVTDGGTTLMVRTTLPGSQACQGFRLTGGPGTALMKIASNGLGTPSGWPTWQSGIVQQGTTPFFADTGASLAYAFNIQTKSAPVQFKGQVSVRNPSPLGSSPCW